MSPGRLPPARGGSPDRWLRLVPAGAVLVLAASVALLAAIVNARPSSLEAADPADHARLTDPPRAVTLVFTGRVDPRQAHVGVFDPAGSAASVGASPTVDGATVVQPVAIRAPGAYQVRYHVVFGDGRTVTGALSFTVGAGGPTTPAALASLPPYLSSTASGHAHSADPTTLAVFAVDGVAVAVGIAAVVVRRRRRTAPRS